jgi:hypothetical protein
MTAHSLEKFDNKRALRTSGKALFVISRKKPSKKEKCLKEAGFLFFVITYGSSLIEGKYILNESYSIINKKSK